jgi:hypothetical protein
MNDGDGDVDSDGHVDGRTRHKTLCRNVGGKSSDVGSPQPSLSLPLDEREYGIVVVVAIVGSAN